MQNRRLVIDANILIRAVLGVRVRELIAGYCESVAFYAKAASTRAPLGRRQFVEDVVNCEFAPNKQQHQEQFVERRGVSLQASGATTAD